MPSPKPSAQRGHGSGPQPVEALTPDKAGAHGGGSTAEITAPTGYWQENSCLPLRCDPSSGAWGLPVVMADEVLFGLPKEDYAGLDYDAERPMHHIDYSGNGGEDGAEGSRQAAGWRSEPESQILVSARREISCWSAPDADLSKSLSALWPQLELGYSMIPGRPCERLPGWKNSFLKIPEPGTPGKKNASAGLEQGQFFSSSEFVGLMI